MKRILEELPKKAKEKSIENKKYFKNLKKHTPKNLDLIMQELDEDDFMVLKQAPCSFLDSDNSCLIYDARPKACREYPHTNRKKFIQLANLTIKNTEICPAVFNIVENLKKRLPR